MKNEFRLATNDDADNLLNVTLQAYKPIRELAIPFLAATADLALVKKNISQNLCYVYEEDKRIAATVSIRMPWGEHPGPFAVPHLWWFAVDPSFARKGVGSKLLHLVEEEIIKNMFKSPGVSLGTAKEHPWLVEMYERKGYVQDKEKHLAEGYTTVFLYKKFNKVHFLS